MYWLVPKSLYCHPSVIMSSIVQPLFPVGLSLVGQHVIVIGGRAEAVDKTRRLLAAQAKVTVVSLRVDPEIIAWAENEKVVWLRREVKAIDMRGCQLVLNTLSPQNPAHASIFAWARRERVLISTYDQPDRSDLGMPAEVKRGHLRIAISTSNASPTIAGALRRALELIIDESEIEEFLDHLGELRQEIRKRVESTSKRRTLMQKAASGITFSGTLGLPNDWRGRIDDMRRKFGMIGSKTK